MKKVLFLTYDFPFPTNTGGKNRAYNMLKYSGKDIKKYLLSYVRRDFDSRNISEVEKINVEVAGTLLRKKVTDPLNLLGLAWGKSIFKSIYYSPAFLEKIFEAVSRFEIDIIHFESFYMGFFINDEFKSRGVKQVFGTENIEHKLYGDYINNNVSQALRPIFSTQVNRIREEEVQMIKGADAVIAVSEPDAHVVRFFKECTIIRNGVDLTQLKYRTPKKAAQTILFVGNFTYFPNVDAINFFYNEIFRSITHDVKLRIIGKKVSNLKFIKDKRVDVTEFVPHIADVYREADIMVAPVRLGGGTNFKILEAMACGVPTIALPERLEGLNVEDGKNILIAKDVQEFKEKLSRLISDEKLRIELSKNAHALVKKEYSWQIIGKELNDFWENL